MQKVGEVVTRVSRKLEKQEKQTGSLEKCEIHGVDKKESYVPGHGYDFACPECLREQHIRDTKKQAIESAYAVLSLPKRLMCHSFDNYVPKNKTAKRALDICKEFSKKLSGGLIMIGGVGTGKTHLAVAICKNVCDQGQKAKFTTIPEIIRAVRATWGGKTDEWGTIESEDDVIEKYSSIPLLVVDEIGSQYGSDSEKIIISEIINNRYNNMLPTVIIGNVTISQAEEYLGKRVMERVKDDGFIITFNWDSYREERGVVS